MEEEKIKEAFSRIKEDIFNLGKELSELKSALLESNNLMKQLNEEIIKLKLENIAKTQEKPLKTIPTETPTHLIKTPTHPIYPTDNPTHPQEIQGLKSPNLPSSIGNEGVPTDRQTNSQTVRQIHFLPEIPQTMQETEYLSTTDILKQDKYIKNVVPIYAQEKPIEQQISEASEILDSLDTIKKDIRRKFKRITKQEMLVFSTIFQVEEQDPEGADYNKIALKLGLSQGSIRDYVHRMINKGIPISKEKLNNKKIILHISKELKRIASLNTIIKLREI